MAAKFEQARFLRVQLQGERFHPFSQFYQKAVRFPFVLEADNNVVGVAHEDDLAPSIPLSPAIRPEVEHVVQVDVGQHRRDDRTLRCAFLADNDPTSFQYSRLQPQLDQPQQSPVCDSVFQESL
jgi:hypothetical protein